MEIAKVVLIGIVLVFVILLLLTFILMLFPKVLGVKSKEKDPGKKDGPAPDRSAHMVAQNQDGDGALLSVLTAAVAAYRADAEGAAAQGGFQVVAFRKTPLRGAGKPNKEDL